ncbi:hypothetical protein FD723_40150 (plasmid) [Nostoc sp. C052]|uniref:hypothetical protein n=1 Tax=Nostoc sp. C052 TaxID=2576902 RepID=UPI0015C391DA|nr:hypothetical protein [Nostoc sp. C052]QLE46426.1 hypothetical protein FD723_40150 [Nostoc sp. C052]
MTVEINQGIERLQLKHSETGKWVDTTILLQLKDGFEVRLNNFQLEVLSTISRNLEEINTTTEKIQTFSNENTKSIADKLEEIYTLLSNQGTGGGDGGESSLLPTLKEIKESLEDNNDSAGQTFAKVKILTETIEDVKASFGSGEVFETLISLPVGEIKTVRIPDGTESLVFNVRKDSQGVSYDLHYSFAPSQLESGKHRTLWAYNEFDKSRLNWNGKSLYLRCPDSTVDVEVTAYYTNP